MAKEWAGTTYGNSWMHKYLILMLKYIDVRILYVFTAIFVIPVCLIVNPSRRIIFNYMHERLHYGYFKSAWCTYLNHCLFAQVVIDKFAMYAGKKINIKIEGYDKFQELSDKPEAFIQLSSHIGNYEIAGYSLKAEKKMFNALVYFGEKASVMKNREKLFNNSNIHMIPVSPDMTHLFEIDSALSNGEIVSMPADRIWGSPKKVKKKFMGAEAFFPYGPFSVATMRSLDVIAVNVMKSACKEYTIYVTRLDYDKEAPRKVQIEQLSSAYVNEIERMLKMYPKQWYNYFYFWNTDERN